MSYRDISELLFVSEKSVQRYVDSYKATGLVAPASQKHGPAKLLSDFEQEFLLESLIANPSTYLSELCEQLEEATGRVVHPSTICRTIQHFGMTRKKSGPLQCRGVRRGELSSLQKYRSLILTC